MGTNMSTATSLNRLCIVLHFQAFSSQWSPQRHCYLGGGGGVIIADPTWDIIGLVVLMIILESFNRCTCFQMACSSTNAEKREKRSAIWDSGILVTCIWATIDLLLFKIIGGYLVHLSQNALNSETAVCIANSVENLNNNNNNNNLGFVVTSRVYGVTFDLVVFQIIWGSFSAHVSKWPLSQQRLAEEQNKSKFVTREHQYKLCEEPLTC